MQAAGSEVIKGEWQDDICPKGESGKSAQDDRVLDHVAISMSP